MRREAGREEWCLAAAMAGPTTVEQRPNLSNQASSSRSALASRFSNASNAGHNSAISCLTSEPLRPPHKGLWPAMPAAYAGCSPASPSPRILRHRRSSPGSSRHPAVVGSTVSSPVLCVLAAGAPQETKALVPRHRAQQSKCSGRGGGGGCVPVPKQDPGRRQRHPVTNRPLLSRTELRASAPQQRLGPSPESARRTALCQMCRGLRRPPHKAPLPGA